MWVNHARVLYALGFHASNNRRRVIALRNLLEALGEKTADAIVHNHPADLYVSCHPCLTTPSRRRCAGIN